MAASQLRNLIYYHIDNELLDTANFLAGRLHALDPRNPDSSHLLALTYLRQHRTKAALDSAQKYGANGRHLGCAYIYAQCCLQLGRHADGVQALEKSRSLWSGKSNWAKHSETTRRHLPDSPAVLTLLAKLWHAYGDFKRAGECYAEVHTANPFIWEAFEGLCDIGADLDLSHMFTSALDMRGLRPQEDIPTSSTTILQTTVNAGHVNVFTPSHDPFNPGSLQGQAAPAFVLPPGRSKTVRSTASDWDTPVPSRDLSDDELMAIDEDKQADVPQAPRRARDIHTSTDMSDPLSRKTVLPSLKRTISGQLPHSTSTSGDPPSNPRRSNRLFGQTTTTKQSSRSATDSAIALASKTERDTRPARTATGAKGRAGTIVGRVVSGNRKVMPPDPADKDKDKLKRAPSRISEKSTASLPSQQIQATSTTTQKPPQAAAVDQTAIDELLDNLKHLALGSYAASKFQLTQAVQIYKSLPTAQRETPWVLAQLGKAYYEQADYRASEDCFARLLKMEPSRVEDIEVYSTVLWHLKNDTALATLCHALRDQHYDAPETWCVIGNAFSLAREHDQAISAFRRATQLDPRFAYAFVLMGHEYIANEEYDAALLAFRKGVTIDRRGYGGWYGLGKTLERMGKFEDAERHYRIAASINPSNATLLVCVGVVLERLRNKKAALLHYARALNLAPASALARFKKARVLMHLRAFDQALVELEVLRSQAPDEANVWFLLGKCYKGLGDRGDALRAFTTALNLDAKASPFIREAMEALDEDYDDDGDSEDD